MAVTNYYTVNGKIRGEGTAAGGFRPYGHDALGSVVATYDSTGALQNTYRNAPYGTQVAKTGTAADPRFLYNGGSGYRTTGRNYSPYYVRMRHLDNETAQWTSVDLLWYLQPYLQKIANNALFANQSNLPEPFGYAGASPATGTDPSGLLHIVVTVNGRGLGVAKIYADPGDILGTDPHTDKWIRSILGGELLMEYPVSNIPTRRHRPFPVGTWPIVGIGHDHSMGPNWFRMGGEPAKRGTWMHSGKGGKWWVKTNGCIRCAEAALNQAVNWYLLEKENPDPCGRQHHRLTFNPPILGQDGE